MQLFNTIFLKAKTNWKSGLTVSLVSIPLSVSLAVASGTTPVVGILTAIWAGLMASIWGGSNYNIVGPTGALSGILAAYAFTHGASSLAMLAIVSGIFILISYAFRFERYLVLIPANTVHGFTLGVAAIIALNQMDFALGLQGLVKHERFIDNVIQSFSHIGQSSAPAVLIFISFLVLLFAMTKYLPKLPAVITLTPIGILLGYLSSHGQVPFFLQTLGQKFSNMTPKLFLKPDFHWDSALIMGGITIAVIAILETMISAKIADVMTKTKYHKRKEMLGLGIANVVTGLMGGIPATAALARTSLNVKTRANDKMSATISSICIALISFILLKYFTYIPMAVIASILVFVAVRMVEREHFMRMFHLSKKDFIIALLVAGVTIYQDPIIGIIFGTAVSLLFFVEKLSKGQFELITNDTNKKIIDRFVGDEIEKVHDDTHTIVYSIKGQLAYINTESHLERFENKLNGYENIILRLRELYHMDLEGATAFDDIVKFIKSSKKKVLVTGVNPLIMQTLKESKEFQKLEKEGLVFERTRDALSALGYQ